MEPKPDEKGCNTTHTFLENESTQENNSFTCPLEFILISCDMSNICERTRSHSNRENIIIINNVTILRVYILSSNGLWKCKRSTKKLPTVILLLKHCWWYCQISNLGDTTVISNSKQIRAHSHQFFLSLWRRGMGLLLFQSLICIKWGTRKSYFQKGIRLNQIYP